MSMDLAEAAELVALAQVSKSHLVCPPNVTLSRTYQDKWRHIQADDIGQPLSARGLCGWSGPDWGPWFYEPGGGPMYDLGVYNVTTLTGLLGPCRWVMAMTGIAISERMVDNRKITVQTDDKIHQPVFGLPPGAEFRHSKSFRTVFAAAEVLFVLMGTMVICNPETGETHLVQKGESVLFQKDTWHHAYAWGDQELRVLEYFAPPPSTGSSGKYAATRPYVSEIAYERRELISHWPVHQAQAQASAKIRVLRDADRLWSLDQADARVLTGIIASTDQLTAGSVRLTPGGRSATLEYGGAAGLYVLAGRVNILIDDPNASLVWFELHPGDGFYIPQGTTYRAFNMGGDPAEYMFGVAPLFHPVPA